MDILVSPDHRAGALERIERIAKAAKKDPLAALPGKPSDAALAASSSPAKSNAKADPLDPDGVTKPKPGLKVIQPLGQMPPPASMGQALMKSASRPSAFLAVGTVSKALEENGPRMVGGRTEARATGVRNVNRKREDSLGRAIDARVARGQSATVRRGALTRAGDKADRADDIVRHNSPRWELHQTPTHYSGRHFARVIHKSAFLPDEDDPEPVVKAASREDRGQARANAELHTQRTVQGLAGKPPAYRKGEIQVHQQQADFHRREKTRGQRRARRGLAVAGAGVAAGAAGARVAHPGARAALVAGGASAFLGGTAAAASGAHRATKHLNQQQAAVAQAQDARRRRLASQEGTS